MGNTESRYRRNDELIKIVGENIRKYRKLKELTIAELSYVSGVATNQIGSYERGEVDTNITMLSLIAKHIGVKTAQLFEGE